VVFQNHSEPFFPADAEFSNFLSEHNAIVADKTHFIPLLEKRHFRYMFLRPRRWGKSTFLNMLAAYYDVKTKDSFKEIFGGLHIGKAPTKSRNSHLVLLFDFSTIRPTGSFEGNCQNIFKNISLPLRRFLFKYKDILGNPLPEEYIIPNDIETSLENVLVSKFKLSIPTALNAVIGSRSPKWLHRFRWRRRVRCPGQPLFDDRLGTEREFVAYAARNPMAGNHSQARFLCCDEEILWQICGEVLAYWSASGFPRWYQSPDGYAANLASGAVPVLVRVYAGGC